MNNLIILQSLIFTIFFSAHGASQPLLTAHVKYEVSINVDGQEDMKQMAGLMGNSTMDVYFTNQKQRVDMSMMGGLILTKMFYDKQTKSSIMLQEMMGQKYKIKLDEQVGQNSKNVNSDISNANSKVTFDKNDRKKIQGYDCYKSTATIDNNGQKISIICYVTDQIKSPQGIIKEADDVNFGGLPLEYTLDMKSMKLVVTTKEVVKNFNSNIFDIPSSGYKEMTLEEFTKKMGGGNLGF